MLKFSCYMYIGPLAWKQNYNTRKVNFRNKTLNETQIFCKNDLLKLIVISNFISGCLLKNLLKISQLLQHFQNYIKIGYNL